MTRAIAYRNYFINDRKVSGFQDRKDDAVVLGNPLVGWSFDPNGWFGIKELMIASVGVGKGTLGKITLFKGNINRGKLPLGEVTISVATLAWDATKGRLKTSLFPVEIAGGLNFVTFDVQKEIGSGQVVGAGSKVVGGLKGSVAIDMTSLALMAGEELAIDAGVDVALAVFGGQLLLSTAFAAAAAISVSELADEIDAGSVAKEAFLEADRTSVGFEREMTEPGHQFKPSPFWKTDPYMKGVEMASQIKSRFFAKFLADSRVAKWRAAHPDQGQQMQQLDHAYQIWVKKDAGAQAAIAAQAARMKAAAKQASYSERFLAYANRRRFTSGAKRVVKVFEELWPGATWIDGGRTMPFSFIQSVPKACYQVASQIDPVSFPADLTRWVTPPTLV